MNKILNHIENMLNCLVMPNTLESLERLQIKSLIIKKISKKTIQEILINKDISKQELVISTQIDCENMFYEISLIYFIKGKRKYYLHDENIINNDIKILQDISSEELLDIQNKLLKQNNFFNDLELQKLLHQTNQTFCLQGVIFLILRLYENNLSDLCVNFYENPIINNLKFYSLETNKVLIKQGNKNIALINNRLPNE